MADHLYCAYGLHIQSEIPLPAPETEPATPDLVIRRGRVDPTPTLPDARSVLRASSDEICVRWPDAGLFQIRAGREITVDPEPTADDPLLATWIQGSAIAVALHQRGLFILHSSAVAIGDAAIAFVGDCGWGKSTLAAYLASRGHRMLSDDIVAIRFESGIPYVLPGFPTLKLMTNTLEFLGRDASALDTVVGDDEKRIHIADSAPSAEPARLQTVFVLGEGATCRIEPMSPGAGIVELLRHAYVATQTEFLRATGTAETHFRNCTSLAGAVPMARLKRPRALNLLPNLAELLEAHVCGAAPVAIP